MRHDRGFTLIELLLSVVIIGIVAGLSLPVFVSYQTRNELSITTDTLVEMIRRAQNFARMDKDDSQWGVAVQSTSFTLFKGATYATRDTTVDEVSTLPVSVTPSGLSEIVFTKVDGSPSATGSMNLTSTTTEVDTVTVNSEGMVNY